MIFIIFVAKVEYSGVIIRSEHIVDSRAVMAVVDTDTEIDMVARREAGVGRRLIQEPYEQSATVFISGKLTVTTFSSETRAGAAIEAFRVGINHIACASSIGTVVFINKLVGIAISGVWLKVHEIGWCSHRHSVVVGTVVTLDVEWHQDGHRRLVSTEHLASKGNINIEAIRFRN